MKDLIIVGTGAVAAENVCYTTTAEYKVEGESIRLKGFIGDGVDLMSNHQH